MPLHNLPWLNSMAAQLAMAEFNEFLAAAAHPYRAVVDTARKAPSHLHAANITD